MPLQNSHSLVLARADSLAGAARGRTPRNACTRTAFGRAGAAQGVQTAPQGAPEEARGAAPRLEQRLERRGRRGDGAEQHHQRCAAPAQRLARCLRLARRRRGLRRLRALRRLRGAGRALPRHAGVGRRAGGGRLDALAGQPAAKRGGGRRGRLRRGRGLRRLARLPPGTPARQPAQRRQPAGQRRRGRQSRPPGRRGRRLRARHCHGRRQHLERRHVTRWSAACKARSAAQPAGWAGFAAETWQQSHAGPPLNAAIAHLGCLRIERPQPGCGCDGRRRSCGLARRRRGRGVGRNRSRGGPRRGGPGRLAWSCLGSLRRGCFSELRSHRIGDATVRPAAPAASAGGARHSHYAC